MQHPKVFIFTQMDNYVGLKFSFKDSKQIPYLLWIPEIVGSHQETFRNALNAQQRGAYSLCLKKTQHTARRHLFHHLGARTEKSLDAGLPCVLQDGGSTQDMPQGPRKHRREWGFKSAFKSAQAEPFLALQVCISILSSLWATTGRQWREHNIALIWENTGKQKTKCRSHV